MLLGKFRTDNADAMLVKNRDGSYAVCHVNGYGPHGYRWWPEHDKEFESIREAAKYASRLVNRWTDAWTPDEELTGQTA